MGRDGRAAWRPSQQRPGCFSRSVEAPAGFLSYSSYNSRFGFVISRGGNAPMADAPVSNQVQNERKMRIASPGARSSTTQVLLAIP
jgi:hypothetical protein